MPNITNNFTKGRMNKDLDERLIPKGEYREAQNVLLSESEDSDVGALETVKGNLIQNVHLSNPSFALSGDAEVIGQVTDTKEKRIVYFVTNFAGTSPTTENIRLIPRAKGAGSNSFDNSSTDNCQIMLYDIESEQLHTLVEGAWLNFSKNHLITGAQVLDDLLFFTDDYNQPRKINIKKALRNSSHYQYESQISIAKYAPYEPIKLLNRNGYWAESNTATADNVNDKTNSNIKSDYLKENFVRFSYRYKYEDGEYSVFAPFTQIVFEPLNNGQLEFDKDARNSTSNEPDVSISDRFVTRKTKVDIMQNAINQVNLRIPIPNADERGHTSDDFNNTYANPYNISEIQVVLKEANSRAIKVVKNLELPASADELDYYTIKPASAGSNTYYRQCFKYIYKSEKPFQVLPEDQTTRVFDQVPLQAKALDIVGNRVVFGNFVENYEHPKDKLGTKGQNYFINLATKADTEFNDTFGIIQNLHRAHKHSNIKQDRTYQVGIVFADKYGRQSPVVLSSSTDDVTDTFTVPYNVVDQRTTFTVATVSGCTVAANSNTITLGSANSDIKIGDRVSYTGLSFNTGSDDSVVASVIGTTVTLTGNTGNSSAAGNNVTVTFKRYSWSSNQTAYGQSLKISFADDQLFPSSAKGVYNGTQNSSTYNPHGWYSYRLVVKQTEQEYYNVYGVHPSNSWTNTGTTKTTDQNGTEIQVIDGKADTSSQGRSWFTLEGDNINKVPRNPTEQDFEREGISGSDTKLYPKVISVDASGPSKLGVANQEFIDVISIGSAIEQGLFSGGAEMNLGTGSTGLQKKPRIYNFVVGKERNPLVAELPNLKEEPVGVTNTNVSVTNVSNVDLDTPFGFPSDPHTNGTTGEQSGGLTVFETKPFESLIDIYYETGTCGLVEDLSDQLASNVPANGADNVSIDTNTFSESTAVNTTVTTVSATDNSTGSPLTSGQAGYNLQFAINSVATQSGQNLGSSFFSVDSNTGVTKLQGNVRRTDTNKDNIDIEYSITDPDNNVTVYETKTLTVTNANPQKTAGPTSVSLSGNEGNNAVVATFTVNNGSLLASEDHIGLTATHNFASFTNHNQFFTLGITGNSLQVKTTTAWISQTATTFFTRTAAQRTMTISLDENITGSTATTFTLQIDEENTVIGGGDLDVSVSSTACDPCNSSTVTHYASRESMSNSQPYVNNVSGYLIVFVGNKIYEDSAGENPVGADNFFYLNPSGSSGGSNEYVCVTTNSSGVVTTISYISACDDRES